MKKAITLLTAPLLLSGCLGSLFSEDTSVQCEKYPDIRTVPERKEAMKPRGLHPCDEKASRAADLKKLEQDRIQIQERVNALREQ